MYTSNELFFPFSIIPNLKNAYTDEWQTLIKKLEQLPEDHPDVLAFILMMSKINGCVSCETDSFRAMKGCLACSMQTLRRMKDEPEQVMLLFEESRVEISTFLAQNPRFTQSIPNPK
ncbi:MAG: hypothetical protein ACOYLB_09685 [Phototrophicaceae bacterium]